jgi:RNA-directed DNA polymerase
MRLVTPVNIRKLQRKLYLKAKQEPRFRFYSLYDKIHRPDILEFAYRLVKSKRGKPGIDGISFAEIESQVGLDKFLPELGKMLQERTYKALPVKRVMIPKPDGSQRPLGIPTIRDRVVQMAMKLVIEAIFEADFVDHSYGFRPKRKQHDAISAITYAMNTGYTQVIDADLSKYFDTIPHAKLLKVVAERICDKSVLHLLKMWLKAPIIEEDKDGKRRTIGGGKNSRKGTPQGGVISPLLSNLYLNILDRIWVRHKLMSKYGAQIIRFADDFVVLCKSDVSRALALIEKVLDRLDLTLNTTKTRIVNSRKEHFTFLGFELQMRKGFRNGTWYPHAQPSRKSLVKIKEEIKELTKRETTAIPIEVIIRRLNTTLMGWTEYFRFKNCSTSLAKLKYFVEVRLALHLGKRHKIRLFKSSVKKYPSQRLYKEYGLYKIPTTAPWKTVHACK